MCKHLVIIEPSAAGQGKTRCGLGVPHNGNSRYQRDIEWVTCPKCLEWADIPYVGTPSRRKGQTATMIDGLRIPYTSLLALREDLPPPFYGSSPLPGPPYPWELQKYQKVRDVT